MSTIKSSAENLTLNADGANNDIKFQSNGSEVASIDQAGLVTASSLNTTGNVGIGTASPTDTNGFGKALDIQGSTGAAIYVGSSGDRGIFGYASGEQHINNPSASGTTRFTINGSERLRIQTGGGISFNGDTAAANALDDYEEGTFTPTLTANSGGSAGTYSNQYGHYTKIGNTVRVTIHCGALKGSLNGQIEVSGLPFTADGNHRGIKMELYVPSGTASVDATGFLYDNTSKIPHWIATAATTDSTGRAFTSSDLGTNGCRIYYFFTYQT